MLYRIELTPAIRDEAQRRASSTRVYAGSHRGRAANLVGALGECAFEYWMREHGQRFKFIGTTTHDYLVGSTDLSLELKTKDRTVIPRPHYEATIPAYNAEHQRPDWYVFVSLLRVGPVAVGVSRFTAAFLVGAYPGPAFHSEAKLWRAGETDPRNGTTFWTDCFNMPIAKLMDLGRAAEEWK